MARKKKAKRKGGGRGRGKPKMPRGFRKGEKVRVGRKHGKLPTGLGEVVGGCYGRDDHVNVMFRGAGGKGRPRLGCVPIKSVKKVKSRGSSLGGIIENPWLKEGGNKRIAKKKVWPRR